MIELNSLDRKWVRLLLSFGGAVLAIGLVVFAALTTLTSADTFGYVAMGRDFIELGRSLFVDHMSFTHLGERLLPNPWLYSLLSGSAFHFVGFPGLFLLFAVLLVLPILVLLVWALRNRVDGTSVFVGLIFLAVAFLTRVQLRPELVAYTLLIITILLSHRYVRDGSLKWVAWLGAVFVLWTQLHSTSSMVLPIFGAAWLHRAIPDLKSKRMIRHLGIVAAFVCLGFVNPNGFAYNPFFLATVHQNPWIGHMTEFLRDQSFATMIQSAMVVVSGLLAIIFFIRGDLLKLASISVMLFYAFQIQKLAPHLSVLIVTQFLILQNERRNPATRLPPAWSWGFLTKLSSRISLARWAEIVVLIAVLSLALHQVRSQIETLLPSSLFAGAVNVDERTFAVDVAEYLRANDLVGPTISEMGTAGYLEFALGKPFSTLIDQRVGILIPYEIFELYRSVMLVDRDLVQNTAKYKVMAVIGANHWAERMSDTALRAVDFSILFIGKSHSIHVPASSGLGFPNVSWLMHDPACLEKIDRKQLASEVDRLKASSKAEEKPILEIAQTGLSLLAPGGAKSIDPQSVRHNPWALRLVSYTLRRAGHYDQALAAQQGLGAAPKLVDFLESALSLSAVGQHEAALGTIFSTGKDYYYGSRQKAKELVYVIDEITRKLSRPIVEPEWLLELRTNLKSLSPTPPGDIVRRSCRPQIQ